MGTDDGGKPPAGTGDADGGKPPDDKKTFDQADVDRIVADRLKRAESKYSDYADLKAKASRFDEAEEKNKSETQKLADRIANAERELGQARVESLQAKVGGEKGLPPAAWSRLKGATREELEADADELVTLMKPADDKGDKGDGRRPKDRPRERLRGGGDPNPTEDTRTVADIVKAIPRI